MAVGDFGAWLKNIHSIAIAAFDLALGKCEINPRVPKSAAAITCDSHFFNFDGLRWFRGCSSHISILIGFKQFIDREGCAMIPNVPRSAMNLAYVQQSPELQEFTAYGCFRTASVRRYARPCG